MGIVWEAYHKGVPSLGVPENPTEMEEAQFSGPKKYVVYFFPVDFIAGVASSSLKF